MARDSRLLVRYSGTENKARVLVEGPRQGRIDKIAARIKRAMERDLAD